MLRRILPLMILAAPAIAQVNGPDKDVYTPFGSPGSMADGVKVFDADWTANNRLAIAWVEEGEKADTLVLALHDPRANAQDPWKILGTLVASGWRFQNLEVAVPAARYGNPDYDRMYVVVSAEAQTQHEKFMTVKAVRLVSAALDGSDVIKVRLAAPPDLTPQATNILYGRDEPSLALTPEKPWSTRPDYRVDIVYHDPDGFPHLPTPPGLFLGGDLMISRSLDRGLSLSRGIPLTGRHALPLGNAKPGYYETTLQTRATLAGDGLSGRTWIAIEDTDTGRVELLSSPVPKKPTDPLEVYLEWTSPKKHGVESHPRIACTDEGKFAFTYLTPPANHNSGSDVHWYTGNYWAGPLKMTTLGDRVWSPANIDVRNSKARIAANTLVDGGLAATPAFFDVSLSDRLALWYGIPVSDTGKHYYAPVAAITPDDTSDQRGTLFLGPDPRGMRVLWLDQ